jgi:hypothetical protein
MKRKFFRIFARVLGGIVVLVAGVFLYLRLTEPNPATGPVAPLKQAAGEVAYRPLVVEGDMSAGGIYDPSIEYSRDGSVGWLAYSSITGDFKPVGPYVHTCLAKTMDHGRSWTYVGRINTSVAGTLDLGGGKTLPGAWRYEVATMVRDDGAPDGDWKLFVHKYFWNAKKDRMPAYGWIAMRTAHEPDGQWSEEVPLFGAGTNPPASYHETQVDLNALHEDLKRSAAYSEPGSLSHAGVLYLSITTLWFMGPDKIVLLKSRDHAKTWEYVSTLANRQDAHDLGYNLLDGSSLTEDHGRFFLLASPASRKLGHDGTLVFQFDSLEQGRLLRDAANKLKIAAYFPPQASILFSPMGAGQSDYDEHNTGGGLIMPQFNVHDYPRVFQIFSTGRMLPAPQ